MGDGLKGDHRKSFLGLCVLSRAELGGLTGHMHPMCLPQYVITKNYWHLEPHPTQGAQSPLRGGDTTRPWLCIIAVWVEKDSYPPVHSTWWAVWEENYYSLNIRNLWSSNTAPSKLKSHDASSTVWTNNHISKMCQFVFMDMTFRLYHTFWTPLQRLSPLTETWL